MKKRKPPKQRNIFALALESKIFRQQVKESKKKKYDRNKEKQRFKKEVAESQLPLLIFLKNFC